MAFFMFLLFIYFYEHSHSMFIESHKHKRMIYIENDTILNIYIPIHETPIR